MSTNLPRIIGITGKARAGKDTFAQMLVEAGHKATIVSLSTPMKEMLRHVGLSQEQLYGGTEKEEIDPRFNKSPRQMMQFLGTEWGRNLIHESMWLNVINSQYEHASIIIPDIRFENEAKWVRDNDGVVIHIKRTGCGIAKSEHTSEKGVSAPTIDFVWTNNGSLLSLLDCAKKTVRYLENGYRL